MKESESEDRKEEEYRYDLGMSANVVHRFCDYGQEDSNVPIPFESVDDSLKEYIKALYYQPESIELSNGEQSDDSLLYALKCDICQKIVCTHFSHYF